MNRVLCEYLSREEKNASDAVRCVMLVRILPPLLRCVVPVVHVWPE
jgi:hypothetical protein